MEQFIHNVLHYYWSVTTTYINTIRMLLIFEEKKNADVELPVKVKRFFFLSSSASESEMVTMRCHSEGGYSPALF